MPLGEREAMPDRLRVAVDGKDAATGGGEQGLAIAATAKGAVNEDCPVAGRQGREDGAEQHGNMAGWPRRGIVTRLFGCGDAMRFRPAHSRRRPSEPPSGGKLIPWRRARSRSIA